MADQAGPRERVVVSGMAVLSAFGRGQQPLLDRAFAGMPAFGPVTRFDTDRTRTTVAATLSGDPVLADELVTVIGQACADAELPGAELHWTDLPGADLPGAELLGAELLGALPDVLANGSHRGRTDRTTQSHRTADTRVRGGVLLLAAHAEDGTAELAREVARRTGWPEPPRTYTAACVAASTAVADAAGMIAAGRAERVVVAAGYLVDAATFAMFDAGRALARDGLVRPFSAGRQGMLLGDAVAAVVLESATAADRRQVRPRAVLAGWGRAGDAYHVCQPRPDGAGLARAVEAALGRAGVDRTDVGYVNANGTGTQFSDAAEAAGLHRVFGVDAERIPVSSTKSVHGHALEASGLLELVCTVLAVRAGLLPVNAGFVEPDPQCRLDLVLPQPRRTSPRYALTLNSAFGGANTALLVGAP